MLLDDEMAEFVSGGVSITLASRNAALIPSVSRAVGCRAVSGTPRRLRIIISAAHAGELLDDIRSSGLVSATFSKPTTHRTLQFKGNDARVDRLMDEDRAALAAYPAAFFEAIRSYGFSAQFTAAFLATQHDEVVVEFTPTDAFQQTPGPDAGARLT